MVTRDGSARRSGQGVIVRRFFLSIHAVILQSELRAQNLKTLNWLQRTQDSHAGVRSCFATGSESKDFVRGLHEEVFSQEF